MTGGEDRLAAYRSKRNFGTTSEPSGGAAGGGDTPIFVIQEHAASSRHYDLRLEVDGALVSWAVPKGPSTDPRDRRLAVRTEDHPLEYADFEGTIPEDEYGGGAVIVWDRGTYRNLKADGDDPVEMADALAQGHAAVWLEGEKIRGGYNLIHSRMGGDEKNWLLIKADDEGADARRNPTSTQRESVLSGRTVEEVGRGEGDEGEDA